MLLLWNEDGLHKSRLGRLLMKCGNYLISELKTNRCLFSCSAKISFVFRQLIAVVLEDF